MKTVKFWIEGGKIPAGRYTGQIYTSGGHKYLMAARTDGNMMRSHNTSAIVTNKCHLLSRTRTITTASGSKYTVRFGSLSDTLAFR